MFVGANDKRAARLLRCPGVVLRAAVIEAERRPWPRLERNLHVGGGARQSTVTNTGRTVLKPNSMSSNAKSRLTKLCKSTLHCIKIDGESPCLVSIKMDSKM